MGRVFGPKASDHPSVGQECPACHRIFVAGDWTTLVMLGPGDDLDERARARQGRAYNAVAVEIHADCAAPERLCNHFPGQMECDWCRVVPDGAS